MIKNLILAATTTNTSLPEKVGAEVLTIRVYSLHQHQFPSDKKHTCELVNNIPKGLKYVIVICTNNHVPICQCQIYCYYMIR